MKFCFSLIFIFLMCEAVCAEEINSEYVIKTRGITIGVLSWSLFINEDRYQTNISLESKGILSKIYSFEGNYLSTGVVSKNTLIPKEYNQIWITKKRKRRVDILFNNLKITKLINIPAEKEKLRINLDELKKYSDPITSFLSILIDGRPSLTLDGRRAYLLKPEKNKNVIKILVKKYRNLWADHKRNNLEYIEVFKDEKSILPKKINIKFEGSIFSVIKN